jgi:hypothetical protein
MSKNTVTTVIVRLVLSWTAVPVVSLAQNPEWGTTLVCVNEGGDTLYVDEWTPENVADFEAKSGHEVTELAVNPVSGDCTDFAGLIHAWFPGTSWLCTLDPAGYWRGPSWVWPMYRPDDAVSPDPATGGCPRPGDPNPYDPYPNGEGRNELQCAAATAVHLTELEVAGDFDRLYAWLHPDAQAVVPHAAMEGWYRDVFAQRPPDWMTVDDVRLVEWTWPVTGKVYPSAAEVTFRQRFGDGEETEGVIRLVRDQGVWRWFFGRDRAFVEEQIARSADQTQDLAGLFPTDFDISDGSPAQGTWHHFEVVGEGTRAAAEVTAWLDSDDATGQLAALGWLGNAFRDYRMEAPGGPIDVTISVHQFADGPPIARPDGSSLSGQLVALDVFAKRWASLRGVTAERAGIIGPGVSRQAGSCEDC